MLYMYQNHFEFLKNSFHILIYLYYHNITYTSPILYTHIYTLREEGYTYQQIASKENIPLSIVANICKRISKTQSYENKPKSGWLWIFSDYQECKVKNLIISKKFETTINIQAHLEVQEDIKVST